MVLYFVIPDTEELNKCLLAPSGECMYEDDIYEDDDQYIIKAIHLVKENGNISGIDISFQIIIGELMHDIGRIEFTINQPPVEHRLHATIFQLPAPTTHDHLNECFNRIKKKITNLIHDVPVIVPPGPQEDLEEGPNGAAPKRPNNTAGGARKKKSMKSRKSKKSKKSRKTKRSRK